MVEKDRRISVLNGRGLRVGDESSPLPMGLVVMKRRRRYWAASGEMVPVCLGWAGMKEVLDCGFLWTLDKRASFYCSKLPRTFCSRLTEAVFRTSQDIHPPYFKLAMRQSTLSTLSNTTTRLFQMVRDIMSVCTRLFT
jgi:hypothetical protein